MMEPEERTALLEVRNGLRALADACVRLPDIEVASCAYALADQLELIVASVLRGGACGTGVAEAARIVGALRVLVHDIESADAS